MPYVSDIFFGRKIKINLKAQKKYIEALKKELEQLKLYKSETEKKILKITSELEDLEKSEPLIEFE
jgi:predicted phage tail protein